MMSSKKGEVTLKIDLLLFARQVESCHLQDVFKNKYYNFKQQFNILGVYNYSFKKAHKNRISKFLLSNKKGSDNASKCPNIHTLLL